MGGYGPGGAEVRGRPSSWCGYVTRLGRGPDFGCDIEKHKPCYVDNPKALLFDAAHRELTKTGLRTKRFNLEAHQVPCGWLALSGCRVVWVLKWVRDPMATWPPECPYGQTKPTEVTNGVSSVYSRVEFGGFGLERPGGGIWRGVSKSTLFRA